MDFTREPIIETVITPKEGCKIVVRSSKATGQEEYFVDAVEVVSFGSSFFFRSMEKPKAFLVPATDYEILEVREARMVLKNVGLDRSIKIGGGRESSSRAPKEPAAEKAEQLVESGVAAEAPTAAKGEKVDKKRDRRKNYRRRRGKDGVDEGTESEAKIPLPEPKQVEDGEGNRLEVSPIPTPSVLSTLLPPPPTLISETIARYRDNALFRGAFFLKEGEEAEEGESKEEESKPRAKDLLPPIPPEGYLEDSQAPAVSLEQPEYGSFEMTEEEEEDVYRQRMRMRFSEDDEEPSEFPENNESQQGSEK